MRAVVNSKPTSFNQKKLTLNKEKVLQIYNQNLLELLEAVNFPDKEIYKDKFVCPICLQSYEKYQLEKSESQITVEHIPPARMGGQGKVLTCKTCNNLTGSKIDVALYHKLNFVDVFTDIMSSSLDVEFQFGNSSKMRGKWIVGEDGAIKIIGDKQRNNPKILEEFNHINTLDTVTMHVRIPKNYTRFPEIALLKIAYLQMFRYFGYFFAYHPNLHFVRQQILHPQQEILKSLGVPKNDIPSNYLGINLITSPKELAGFLVAFDLLSNNTVHRKGIIIPGTHSREDFYDLLSINGQNVKLDFVNIQGIPSILGNPFLLHHYEDYYMSEVNYAIR